MIFHFFLTLKWRVFLALFPLTSPLLGVFILLLLVCSKVKMMKYRSLMFGNQKLLLQFSGAPLFFFFFPSFCTQANTAPMRPVLKVRSLLLGWLLLTEPILYSRLFNFLHQIFSHKLSASVSMHQRSNLLSCSKSSVLLSERNVCMYCDSRLCLLTF